MIFSHTSQLVNKHQNAKNNNLLYYLVNFLDSFRENLFDGDDVVT